MDIKYLIKESNYYRRLGKGHVKRMFLKFLFAKTFFSKFVNTSIYNKIYWKRIDNQVKNIQPMQLQIETTSYCNARCIMCPHVNMKRKKMTMSQEDFIKICKNVLPYKDIKTITLTGFGEPFMDSELIDKIRWVNENYPNIGIDIYTNVSLLTSKITDELIRLKLHKINFSINGTSRTYKKIMGLDYENTKKNILYFLKKKKELGLKYPLTNISLMVLKENQREINEVIDFWRDKTDSVMAYLPSNWAGELEISAIKQNQFRYKRWPCKVLWSNITIDVEGNIIMCCRDYESKVKIGNLKEEDINKIWNNKKFNKIRKEHLNMTFDTQICRDCDNTFDSSLEWWG